MLTHDRTTQQMRPSSTSKDRWWLITGLTGLATIAVGGFGGTVLGFDLDPTWMTDVISLVPLGLAGLITGYVGGNRNWWLLVPTLAAPLVWLGLVVGEGELYPAMTGFAYWSLLIGTTTLVTVIATWLIRRFAR